MSTQLLQSACSSMQYGNTAFSKLVRTKSVLRIRANEAMILCGQIEGLSNYVKKEMRPECEDQVRSWVLETIQFDWSGGEELKALASWLTHTLHTSAFARNISFAVATVYPAT
jgi:hypothetical protein